MEFNRSSVLSLREISLRRLTVLLWNAPRNLLTVINCGYSSIMPSDHIKNWNGKLSGYTLSKLKLPESLEKHIKRLSKPIGLQMVRWKLYHEAYLETGREGYFHKSVLGKLQWTAAGAVDYRRTAEVLVGCDVLDVVKRYKLACLYCLEHYIPKLWEELPQEIKANFYPEGAFLSSEPLLHCLWPYILKGEEHKLGVLCGGLVSFNQFAFQRTSPQGNKAAAEYFLQKLTPEERPDSAMRAVQSMLLFRSWHDATPYPSSFPNRNISDVVFYLLSEMTPEQQVKILRETPADVFGCFLDWPRQDAFFDFADAMWTWMQSEDLERRARNYNSLLHKLQRSIQKSDYSLPDLFQNFFMSSPADFKKHFVERELFCSTFFTSLFIMGDTATIKVILSHLDAEDKLRLASSEAMLNIYYHSISKGRGHVVEMFLRETRVSREDKLRLKEHLMGELKRMDNEAIKSRTPRWTKFFEFLGETENQTKRNTNNKTLTEVKKLCFEKHENSTSIGK